MKTPLVIEADGCTLEHHKVQTEDGYILTLERLLPIITVKEKESSRNTPSNDVIETERESPKVEEAEGDVDGGLKSRRPAALFVHGFQCSSRNFMVAPSRDNRLPCQFLDQGYDVFLANLRGTSLSKEHATLPVNSRKYWNFSWHEMGQFDLPAMVNYILELTGNESIYYIGHSMGNSVFFSGMAVRPEYCTKIKAMISLAPAVYSKNIRNKPIKYGVAPLSNWIGKIRCLSEKEAFAKTCHEMVKSISPPFRNPDKLAGTVLKNVGTFFGGVGIVQTPKEHLRLLAKCYPESTSVKTMSHGMQCVTSKQFQHFDYGRSANRKRYGQTKPPKYDLSKVTVPVATFYSLDDELCTAKDVTQLSKDLPNSIDNYGIEEKGFTHGDFLWGKDAKKLFHQRIFDIMWKSENTQKL